MQASCEPDRSSGQPRRRGLLLAALLAAFVFTGAACGGSSGSSTDGGTPANQTTGGGSGQADSGGGGGGSQASTNYKVDLTVSGDISAHLTADSAAFDDLDAGVDCETYTDDASAVFSDTGAHPGDVTGLTCDIGGKGTANGAHVRLTPEPFLARTGTLDPTNTRLVAGESPEPSLSFFEDGTLDTEVEWFASGGTVRITGYTKPPNVGFGVLTATFDVDLVKPSGAINDTSGDKHAHLSGTISVPVTADQG